MQYGALRRKIGGTYKDFFKSYVEGNFMFDLKQICVYVPVHVHLPSDPPTSWDRVDKRSG